MADTGQGACRSEGPSTFNRAHPTLSSHMAELAAAQCNVLMELDEGGRDGRRDNSRCAHVAAHAHVPGYVRRVVLSAAAP